MTAAPIRVLLVEPHDDTRELYELGLAADGFIVCSVLDGPSAMAACTPNAPSVVVGAVGPADCGTLALLIRLAQAAVPVIALTTVAPDSDHGVWRAGLSSVVMKPCLPAELGTTIRKVLNESPR